MSNRENLEAAIRNWLTGMVTGMGYNRGHNRVGNFYTVENRAYSYETAIGIIDGSTRTLYILPKKFSTTTSKHQNALVRIAKKLNWKVVETEEL